MTGSSSSSRAPTWKTTHPEFVAVILASTVGSRLDPLTTSSPTTNNNQHNPKHLLEVAGISLLDRLLTVLMEGCGFTEVVVALAHNDQATRETLLLKGGDRFQIVSGTKDDRSIPLVLQSNKQPCSTKITLFNLEHQPAGDNNTAGSLDALRQIEAAQIVPLASQMVVVPGDLVVLNAAPLKTWIHQHRQGQKRRNNKQGLPRAACSVLLTDVGEVDEHGHPLKESAKQKKGLLAREDDDEIDYTVVSSSPTNRLIWKQSKVDVEEDKDMVGSTPKLVLPLARLLGLNGGTSTRVSTDWNDVHCYCLAPWVRRWIAATDTTHGSANRLHSIQRDLIPRLVARQFRGVRATLAHRAGTVEPEVVDDIVQQYVSAATTTTHASASLFLPTSPLGMSNNVASPPNSKFSDSSDEYAVLAHIVTDKSVFRSHTISSYLYANREIAHKVSAIAAVHVSDASDKAPPNPCLQLPDASQVKPKFHTVLLRDCTVGDKVTFKQSVVGRHCQLGAKCRLNNVVLHDHVVVGDNVVLQNTVVSSHATIGENCNLNDCQIAPGGVAVPAGTKQKGECFRREDNHGDGAVEAATVDEATPA